MSRLGISIGKDMIRAVKLRRDRRRAQIVEIASNADAPEQAVSELRAHVGIGHRLGVAVELSELFVKRVSLPPVAAAEKSRIIALEPERFFPVRGEALAVATRQSDELAFAVREAEIERWGAALESLGSIERIEPAPIARARALRVAGVRDAHCICVRNGGVEMTHLKQGDLAAVRNVFGPLSEALRALGGREVMAQTVLLDPWDDSIAATIERELAGSVVKRIPMVHGVAAPYLGALGAALAVGRPAEASLTPPALAKRIADRRRIRIGLAATAAMVAAGVLVGSVGQSRSRVVRALDREIAFLNERAQPLLDLQSEVMALSRESSELASIEQQRSDPLEVLLAVSALLPADAYLRSIRGSDGEWRLNGHARDAAQLVPLFEGDSRFEDVRFLTATSRVVVGQTTYEDFSLALRFVPAP